MRPTQSSISPRRATVTVVSALALAIAACATNPVTGKKELSLIPESQEIQIGKESDQQVVAQMGLYNNEATQAYVTQLGRKLAAHSERPNLPWTFRVVDDPVVNAFALPGGFVYVTRGLMTHLNSEAELVSVLGHEIGHVTAKHGVNQMSKQEVAQIGLGVGSILGQDYQDLIGLASQGLGLLFLKFSRSDESQADDIGFRYLVNAGYDPRPMGEVFDTLARVSAAQGGGRIPNWASTHPAPEDRRAWANAKVAALGKDFSHAEVGRERYLAVIDGMTFGTDPRQGYFKGNTFYHPDMAFRFDVPAGWKTANGTDAVAAQSQDGSAALQVTLAKGDSPEAARDAFFRQQGIQPGRSWQSDVNGLHVASREFQAATEQTTVTGIAHFVELNNRVFQIVGFGAAQGWSQAQDEIQASMKSFQKLTDPKVLAVKPWKVDIVQLPQSMTVEQFASKYPGPAPVATIALINHVSPGAQLAAGSRVKRIVGEPLA